MSEQKASNKAKENKSTGIMLIVFAVIGCSINSLNFFGMINIPVLSRAGMNFGLFTALMIVFFLFGISSLKSAKQLACVGEEQDAWEERALAWAKEHMTKELIDSYDSAMVEQIENTLLEEHEKSLEEAIAHGYKKNDKSEQEEETENLSEGDLMEGEDVSYFTRAAKMKAMLIDELGTVDEAVLDDVIEKLYDSLFAEKMEE